ncbi:endoplasmic reticulum mannosyl-oligosaccharide 1,2-alpha-mannosidase [Pseudozyma hubeiensis SY62]|uniref:Endoplasmic reticulum mannosyl-oligosaccharide 1,2-alpha-mannosidase n=1 Tax=Pseudozyma hubeiensis (strain SY62) TaxID=1305764 RepID=R9P7N6_PSEHS|nr:endoplasmic reticulum mannosyl-oligosaccharide 1,2-alpha-mannosidase [Pseudozyma hubeiensis SY62]GAC97329.1 endoplasmic reticulum mannosyl-oligosaccharide 1,2-alpha-mannosidase [Pseudozyma hubeiensis SY62]
MLSIRRLGATTLFLGLVAALAHGRAVPQINEAVFAIQDSIEQSSYFIDNTSEHGPSSTAYNATLSTFSNGEIRPLDYWTQEEGVGHFSEWSKATKLAFLSDWVHGKAHEWTLVQGNEGGDLDSMTAALAWAYHLSHSTLHHPQPRKAIALLQTPLDALELRPENKVALSNSKMSSGHRDLLTIDELPAHPKEVAKQIKGIVLVDHPLPLSVWQGAKVLGIIDHHHDRGVAPDAKPRIFEQVASCTTLVARQMLDELEAISPPPQGPGEYHMPHELLELMLDAIAIDSDGLNPKKSTDVDAQVSARVLARSNWRNESLSEVMDRLDKELGRAKRDLSHLTVRDLLRRDWKGDVVQTLDPDTPDIHLGFASTPVSLDQQILRTRKQTIVDWFKTERRWTAEIRADVSLCLNKYKNKKGKKVREITLTVRHDHRINRKQADSLFKEIEAALKGRFDMKKHEKVKHLKGKRQMVWVHGDKSAGRKVVRPIVEEAVKKWVSP